AREVAARDLEANAMPLEKHVAGDSCVDRDLIGLAGRREHGLLERFAITQPEDSVGQVARHAIGEDVHELGGEIGVGSGCCCIERTGADEYGPKSAPSNLRDILCGHGPMTTRCEPGTPPGAPLMAA